MANMKHAQIEENPMKQQTNIKSRMINLFKFPRLDDANPDSGLLALVIVDVVTRSRHLAVIFDDGLLEFHSVLDTRVRVGLLASWHETLVLHDALRCRPLHNLLRRLVLLFLQSRNKLFSSQYQFQFTLLARVASVSVLSI